MALTNAFPDVSEQQLDVALPPEMSIETVYRILRAKIDRLATRVAVLEDENQALRAGETAGAVP